MTILTEALNRIYNWNYQVTSLRLITEENKEWLRSYGRTDYLPLLKPGLSKSEIEEITKDLDFQLPSEVIELYQWKNGTPRQHQLDGLDWLFDVGLGWRNWYGYALVPLEEVIEQYLEKRKLYHLDDSNCPGTLGGITLDLFESNDCHKGYLIINEASQFNNYIFFIYFKGGRDDTLAIYTSLTSMMQTLADCYEQASYKAHENHRLFDEEKAREIWRKYNSADLVEQTLKMVEEFEFEYNFLEPGIMKSDNVLKTIGDALGFTQDSRLLEPLIEVLRKPPLNNDCDEGLNYLRAMATLYIRPSDINAIEPLIDALKDEYWATRYHAANTLEKFKDSRAFTPLTKILQDPNSNVRWMARETIKKFILYFPELEEQIPF